MPGESSFSHLDELCDICGHVGYQELLVTCSKCCCAHEHVYCMRICTHEVPQIWVCEACLLRNDKLSPKSGSTSDTCNDSQFQVHSKKLKSVEAGKVKFLAAEEAIRLSSGSQKMGSPQRTNFRLKCGLLNAAVPRSRKTPIPSKIATQVFSCLPETISPSVISSQLLNFSPQGGAQINSMINDQTAKMSKQSKGKATHVVAESKNFAVEERELENLLLKYEQHRRYLPTLKATWSGGFKFFDFATPGEFYGGIQAQTPCRVHPNALKFAQKMPTILQVALLPRCQLWAELFGQDRPDYCDISLYFFPAVNIERSQQNIFCLSELLEINDSLMRSYIDGLELLIFSSKQLHEDSQRVIASKKSEYFLWGIFRHVKSDQILHKRDEELPSLVSSEECAFDDAKTDNFETVDMDIDMEGGRNVGTVDLVVSKYLSWSTGGINGKGDVDSAAEKMLLEQKHKLFDSSIKFAEKIQCSRGKLANAKDDIRVPPGFKEKFKDDIDVPPGFKEKSKLNYNIKKNRPGQVDGGVLNQMESIDQKRILGGDFEAFSSQPQRYSKDNHSTVSHKHHLETAADKTYEPFAAYWSASKAIVERIDYENLGRTRKKELVVMPFSNKHANSVSEGHGKDRNKCWEPYLVEVKTESKMDVPVRWSPPPKDWVKLNIEGSSRGYLGRAGAAGIVRNESGKWLLGYTETLGYCSSLAAELNALYKGLKLVWEEGFRKILVESASIEAVKCLERAPASLGPNGDLIESCRDLLKRNWQCRVKLTQREANLCANWLAAHAEDQPLGTVAIFKNPPWKLIPIFQNDCTGITQAHVS